MYKICKTEEAFSRQREFENCLLKTMEATSYSDISITDLCKQVGIARKNFYRYFDHKDDVLCALIDHTILDFSRFQNEDNASHSEAPKAVIQFLAYWQSHRVLLDVLEKNQLSHRLVERMLMHAWKQDAGFLRLLASESGENDPNVVLFAVSGIVTLLVSWHHSGFKEPKEQLANTIFRLMTRPIANYP